MTVESTEVGSFDELFEEFGFELIDATDMPDVRERASDAKRWAAVQTVLEMNDGAAIKAKVYPTNPAGAGAVASQIRNGKHNVFSKDLYTASAEPIKGEVTETDDEGVTTTKVKSVGSILYIAKK